MEFNSQEDIEAPVDFIWGKMTDTAFFERAALRRGADLTRTDGGTGFGLGAKWHVGFSFRGKYRELDVEVIEIEPPDMMVVELVSKNIHSATRVELVPLSKTRTRLTTKADIKAKTLSARLLLQSLRLAKGTVQRRAKTRSTELVRRLEESYRQSRAG